MSIERIKERIPDYAKDIRINIGRILTEEHSKELTLKQIYSIALASAYSSQSAALVQNIKELAKTVLEDADHHAIKAAVSIMAMNNIYYRSIHMLSNSRFAQLPAGLRMQVIGKPGIDKKDFELISLAVSAINGCHHCVDSHTKILESAGVKEESIQSSIRIAAVVFAVAKADQMENE